MTPFTPARRARRPFSVFPGSRGLVLLGLLAAVALQAAPAAGQADAASRESNQPVEPFRIAGNLYYVGASDVTSFLITTPQGHILLDGGFVETAPQILANLHKLGFRPDEVKILLSSHAHLDHAGGLARLKEATRARFIASAADAPLLAAGGHGDFRFGDRLTFPPIRADRTVADGESVTLGGTTLTAHLTPGHTKGNTTWTFATIDGGKPYRVVFAASTTINPGVRLVDRPSYPGIAEDYATSFRVLEALPCDIFLSAHGSFFHLAEKARRLAHGQRDPNPFFDPEGYKGFLAWTKKVYLDQLKSERAGAAPPAPR